MKRRATAGELLDVFMQADDLVLFEELLLAACTSSVDVVLPLNGELRFGVVLGEPSDAAVIPKLITLGYGKDARVIPVEVM